MNCKWDVVDVINKLEIIEVVRMVVRETQQWWWY